MFNIINEIISHVKNNVGASLITIGTITVSMTILSMFLIVFVNLKNLSKGLGEEINLIIYLEDSISKAQKNKLRSLINKRKETKEVIYISKDEALNNFKNDLGNDQMILEGLGKNPLPASFKVKIKKNYYSSENLDTLAEYIRPQKGIENIDYGKEWLEKFRAIMIFSKILLMAIGSLLCIGLLFIIANTIRLSLYSNIKEIEIMKLVGASPWYIKTPFIIEGMIEGFIGSFLSILILILFYKLFLLKISSLAITIVFLNSIIFIPTSFIAGIILSGGLIGFLGSLLSVRSFLKET